VLVTAGAGPVQQSVITPLLAREQGNTRIYSLVAGEMTSVCIAAIERDSAIFEVYVALQHPGVLLLPQA